MEQENPFYKSLERAYNKGVPMEVLEKSLSEEAIAIARDYYSKKKDGTEDSQIASPSVSASEPSVNGTVSLSTRLDSDSRAVNFWFIRRCKVSTGKSGVTLEQMQ
jgi:hypothetical protein